MFKGIDPKWGAYLGLLVLLEQAIGHGGAAMLTNVVPTSWIDHITATCNALANLGVVIMTYQAGVSAPQAGPWTNAPVSPVVKVIVLAVALSALVFGVDPAQAQTKLGPIGQKIANDVNQTKAVVTGQPVLAAPLVCDFKIFTQLKPDNLIDVIKTCVNEQKMELVDNTQRALESAKAFTPNPDQDAVNCLDPGLALFKAALPIRAIPEQPATATTPVVAAQPAHEPGIILLFQKYREFVLRGALTSCQAWVNTPVNATISAGIGAAAGAAGAAAIFVPK